MQCDILSKKIEKTKQYSFRSFHVHLKRQRKSVVIQETNAFMVLPNDTYYVGQETLN